MSVFELDIEVVKGAMVDIENETWRQIRDRLEPWVSKPFYSLQGAFVSQHESNLIAQVDILER